MGNKLAKNRQDILSPAYIYDFGVPVWRIRADSASGSLAIEVRDGEVLLTVFFTLDCNNFKLQQLALPQQQLWWQGLEEMHQGLVYLHGYGDRKLGQHKGITAHSATGELQWEKADQAYYGIGSDGLYSFRVASPENGFLLLNARTGQELEKGINQSAAAEAVAAYNGVRNGKSIYPGIYLEGETYFESVRSFLQEAIGASPVQAIEYAETEKSFIVSFYEQIQGVGLRNDVAVFSLEGEIHLRETLAHGLIGIGSDTFFIFNNYLFFISNKSILQAVLLPVF